MKDYSALCIRVDRNVAGLCVSYRVVQSRRGVWLAPLPQEVDVSETPSPTWRVRRPGLRRLARRIGEPQLMMFGDRVNEVMLVFDPRDDAHTAAIAELLQRYVLRAVAETAEGAHPHQ